MYDVPVFDVRLYILEGQIQFVYNVIQIFMYVCMYTTNLCMCVCVYTHKLCVCMYVYPKSMCLCMCVCRIFMYLCMWPLLCISVVYVYRIKFYVFGPVVFHQNSFCKSSRFYCRSRDERPWALLVDIPSRCKI